MKYALALFCFILLGSSFPIDECKCNKVDDIESTHLVSGQLVWILYDFVVKFPQGSVVAHDGGSMPDALVEVFAVPDKQSVPYSSNEERLRRIEKLKRIRVAACKTTGDGSFCFKGLSPNDYEMRISKEGFKTMSCIVTVVSPGKHATDQLIPMQMFPID